MKKITHDFYSLTWTILRYLLKQCTEIFIYLTYLNFIPSKYIFNIIISFSFIVTLLYKVSFSKKFKIYLKQENIIFIMLDYLTSKKLSFPISVNIKNLDLVKQLYLQHKKLIVCGIHVPLNPIFHNALLKLDIPYAFISGDWLTGNKLVNHIWGNEFSYDRLKIIYTSPYTLIEAKKYLNSQHVVAGLIDRSALKDGDIQLSPNLVKLAKITKSPVLLFTVGLNQKRKLALEFHEVSKNYTYDNEHYVEHIMNNIKKVLLDRA